MIFDMVIYVTLINVAEIECILLLLKSCLFLCFDISWRRKLKKKFFIANVIFS